MLCNSTRVRRCRPASSSSACGDRLDGRRTTTSSGANRRSPTGGTPLPRCAGGRAPRMFDAGFAIVLVTLPDLGTRPRGSGRGREGGAVSPKSVGILSPRLMLLSGTEGNEELLPGSPDPPPPPTLGRLELPGSPTFPTAPPPTRGSCARAVIGCRAQRQSSATPAKMSARRTVTAPALPAHLSLKEPPRFQKHRAAPSNAVIRPFKSAKIQ